MAKLGAKIVHAALDAGLGPRPEGTPPEAAAWANWLANLQPPHLRPPQPEQNASGHVTGHDRADVFGSPITSGKIGNGPGVGLSGAGTQRNFLNRGL